MLNDMVEKKDFDIEGFGTEDRASFASRANSMRLMTIHQAKGREFDAVAVVDVHQGKLPFFSNATLAEKEEDRRKLYVAIIRPRKLLMIITNKDHYRNTPSEFLNSMRLKREEFA